MESVTVTAPPHLDLSMRSISFRLAELHLTELVEGLLLPEVMHKSIGP